MKSERYFTIKFSLTSRVGRGYSFRACLKGSTKVAPLFAQRYRKLGKNLCSSPGGILFIDPIVRSLSLSLIAIVYYICYVSIKRVNNHAN